MYRRMCHFSVLKFRLLSNSKIKTVLGPSKDAADLVGLTHSSREWRFTEVVIAEGVVPLKHL